MAKNVCKAGEVATTVSAGKMKLAAELGADVVINYQEEAFKDRLSDYDAVLAAVGNTKDYYPILKTDGVGALVSEP